MVQGKEGKEQTMSRYIDADDVANAIYHHFPSVRTMADARGIIEEAPSIDIVPCKECKHEPICSHSVQHTTHEPTTVTIGYKSVDYCSYGERESE